MVESEKHYKVPNVATDAIVLRPKIKDSESLHDILLIIRGRDPFKDCLAYPGGFVDYNEDPKDACLRELKEECGIDGHDAVLVTVAGKPDRDPRKHIISIVYHVQVKPDCEIKAGDDAAHADWYDLKDVWENNDDMLKLAFDHRDILKEFLTKFHPKYLSS
jgi:8-oxo-dGTP diphosphatase